MRFQIFKSPNDIFISIKISPLKFAYFGQRGFVFLSSHPIKSTMSNVAGFKFQRPSVSLCRIVISGLLQ